MPNESHGGQPKQSGHPLPKRYLSEHEFDERGRQIREAAREAVVRALAGLEADFVLHLHAIDAYLDDHPIREWASALLVDALVAEVPDGFPHWRKLWRPASS